MPFNPGECVAQIGKREQVVVPRDIYRPDIKAVKVNSPGSYLDGMVLFYYAASDVKCDTILLVRCTHQLLELLPQSDG